ncbi:adenylate kinase family enzyme [Lewinella aquimaris]|uniref:Adenylate kinase family enzyme n=1 Tax=Neolewinella aquimaris TaxID=1835722 RepID=A0A840DYL9_9BACT|nr:hypothetical protein [Neolewinella aquimaris]MBB4078000.1 adenylate kinase family enzyme [Neolewinella aquimaris]
MQRVLITGCCGAGKSTLARKLSDVTGLEVIHLDENYWKAGWQETEKAEWTEKVRALASKPTWIMDGNFAGTLDLRIERADTIVYLDYRTITCLWRITRRIVRYHWRVRPDMPAGCPERFDAKFYHYVATYNLFRRTAMLRKLTELSETKRVLIFKNDSETARFLDRCRMSMPIQG